MNTPTPQPNDEGAIRDALRRAAARVTEPAFDAALHHATMRRIRGLATRSTETCRPPLFVRFAATAAVTALAIFAVMKHPDAARKNETPRTAEVVSLPPAPPRASAMAYATVASRGDAALLAMLDQDARELLPGTSTVFDAPLR